MDRKLQHYSVGAIDAKTDIKSKGIKFVIRKARVEFQYPFFAVSDYNLGYVDMVLLMVNND